MCGIGAMNLVPGLTHRKTGDLDERRIERPQRMQPRQVGGLKDLSHANRSQVRGDFVSEFGSNHDVNESGCGFYQTSGSSFIALIFAPESEEGESQLTYNRVVGK